MTVFLLFSFSLKYNQAFCSVYYNADIININIEIKQQWLLINRNASYQYHDQRELQLFLALYFQSSEINRYLSTLHSTSINILNSKRLCSSCSSVTNSDVIFFSEIY